MSYSKRQLEAFGEPLGESVTRTKPGGRVYGSGGGGGQTQTSAVDPRFDSLINYATQTAGKVNSAGYTPYTGDRFAGLNDTQKSGIDMITERAQNGSPVMDQANQTLTQTLQGGNTNPYLDAMVNRAQINVMGNANAAQARSGSFGNSGLADSAARQMGDVATQMYGNAYAGDRANQMQALNLAPTYGQQPYQDAAQLMKAGQTVQDADQQGKDFNYQQFQEQQNLPYKQMAAYQGLLGSSGATSTTTKSGGGK